MPALRAFFIVCLYLFRTEHMGTGTFCGVARTSVPDSMCIAVGSELIRLFFVLYHIHCGTETDVFPLHITADKRFCPAEQPLGFITRHVDTTV